MAPGCAGAMLSAPTLADVRHASAKADSGSKTQCYSRLAPPPECRQFGRDSRSCGPTRVVTERGVAGVASRAD